MKEILEELSWNLSNISKLCLSLAEKENITSTEDKSILVSNKITIEKVREVLAEKSKIGKTEEVKEILRKFGAKTLSQVKEENFEKVIKEAKKL